MEKLRQKERKRKEGICEINKSSYIYEELQRNEKIWPLK